MDLLAHVDEIVYGRVVVGVSAAVVLVVAARRGKWPPLALSLHVSAGLALLS